MSDHTPDDDDRRWQAEQEASFERQAQKVQYERRLIGGLILVVLAIGAILPALLGLGVFGFRSLRAQRQPIWFYNTTEKNMSVDFSYRTPLAVHYNKDLVPYGVDHLYLKTGKRQVTVTDSSGESNTTDFSFDHPTLITLGDSTCYGVFDVTSFYHKAEGTPGQLKLVKRIPAGTFIYQSEADTMIVPRQALPQKARGSVYWVEDFGCNLMAADQEHILMLRARMKMEERQRKLKASQKQGH